MQFKGQREILEIGDQGVLKVQWFYHFASIEQ